MDAAEIMEWVAFFQLKDDKVRAQLEDEIAEEASLAEKTARIRAFLSTMVRRR